MDGECPLLSFKLHSWNALAPGLEDKAAWSEWLLNPVDLPEILPKLPLKQIPPMLRRRLTELGKCAVGAALPLLEGVDAIPAVFASRHGDTPLTLSLLESIADKEPMSPTGFSLAVHNSIGGLLSIARQDTSEITAIASMDALIPHALLEAATQLSNNSRVLCVVYDVPLPELYRPYCISNSYPFAVAMVLSLDEGDSVLLDSSLTGLAPNTQNNDALQLMRFLCGFENQVQFSSGQHGSAWRISRR